MKTLEFSVRFAVSEDVPQLVALLKVLFEQEADFVPDPSLQEKGLIMILESSERGDILVAESDDQLVGMVSLLYQIFNFDKEKPKTCLEAFKINNFSGFYIFLTFLTFSL